MCTFISILAAVKKYLHWDIPVYPYTIFSTNDSWISKDRIYLGKKVNGQPGPESGDEWNLIQLVASH